MVRSFESQGRSFAVSGRALNPVPVTRTFITSFESGVVTDHFTADTGAWSYVSESGEPVSAQHGARLLKSTSGSNSEIVSPSGNGLDNYFSKGQEATVWVWMEGSATFRWYFRATDEFDQFYVQFSKAATDLSIWDGVDGVQLAGTNIDPALSTWHKIIIQQDDGATFGGADNDINAEAIDTSTSTTLGTVSGNDATSSTVTGVGCEIRNNTVGDAMYSDSWELTVT